MSDWLGGRVFLHQLAPQLLESSSGETTFNHPSALKTEQPGSLSLLSGNCPMYLQDGLW